MPRIEDLVQESLRQWANQRLAVDSESIEGAAWRGDVAWTTPYMAVVRMWDKENPGARPPAFRNGLARPEQLLPGTPGSRGAVWAHTIPKGGKPGEGELVRGEDWTFWMLRCGRGFGKTRTGAECVIEWAKAGISPILIAGPTSHDIRASMVEGPGESAIMKISRRDFMPDYEPSKRKLTFPNGVECQLLSAEEPERFRGVQFVKAWLDELAAWKLLKECWDQIRYVMRVKRPNVRVQLVITTTPRAKPVIRELSRDPRCALTVRPSYDNQSNLAQEFVDLIAQDEGTRQGRQEIHGEVLEDIEGALWTEDVLDRTRLSQVEYETLMDRLREGIDLAQGRVPGDVQHDTRIGWGRVVEAVDPPGGKTECGIVIAGRIQGCPWNHPGCRGHLLVLSDRTVTESPAPSRWAPAVARGYHELACNQVVAEINFGGDMVKHTIQTEDSSIAVRVVTATRGKRVRAEPVSALWTGVHPRAHLIGRFPELELEMTTWVPDQGQPSPNRMDALVWAATDLMIGGTPTPSFGPVGIEKESNWR